VMFSRALIENGVDSSNGRHDLPAGSAG
jgi:hypothetical protein